MKIAIASENNQVAQHFGYCSGFNIYSIEENKIIEKIFVENPGHKPGFLPNYLQKLGINVIIAGGIGGNAIGLFNNNKIDVNTGASGQVDDVINQFLKGTLISSQSACHEHLHKDSCH